MKTTKNYLYILVPFLLFVMSCKEEGRVLATSDDSIAPQKPTEITYKPLFGGARFYYSLPNDEDLLSVNAKYTNAKNESFSFSSSYFTDSLDVFGFGDTIVYDVELYALDRAGNKSIPTIVKVKPLESAVSRVLKSLVVKPGFSSFFIDWTNELEQSINVYADFSYTKAGTKYEFTSVFSSNLLTERRFVEDLVLTPSEPVKVSIRVEDMFGNISQPTDKGEIALFEDVQIPKENWYLPPTGTSKDGVVGQGFGDGHEGRMRYVIDGLIDRGDNLNFMHTNARGRTGLVANGNMPWNFIIDLGGYYELSRIVTVQRHSGGLANINRGQYYQSENVGKYKMYLWDEDSVKWSPISIVQIPVPVGLSELEFVKKGEAGDMAYMYPDDPKYTKRTRWFRYEALKAFTSNYTGEGANCLSEITLFGKAAGQ